MCNCCSQYPYSYYSPYQSPYQYSPYQYYGYNWGYPPYGYAYPYYGMALGYAYTMGNPPAYFAGAVGQQYPRGEYRVGNCLMICQ